MVRQSSYLVYGPLLAGRRIKGSAHFRARSWLHRAAEPSETLISAHFRAHAWSLYLSDDFSFSTEKCARFPLFMRTHLFFAHFCAQNAILMRMNVRTNYRRPPFYQLFACARLCALRISHKKRPVTGLFHLTDPLHLFGISLYIFPSNSCPFFFLFHPPHCLKKNGISSFWQISRISRIHALSTGLALLPDSPPVTTQSIPLKSICFNDPSKG